MHNFPAENIPRKFDAINNSSFSEFRNRIEIVYNYNNITINIILIII